MDHDLVLNPNSLICLPQLEQVSFTCLCFYFYFYFVKTCKATVMWAEMMFLFYLAFLFLRPETLEGINKETVA